MKVKDLVNTLSEVNQEYTVEVTGLYGSVTEELDVFEDDLNGFVVLETDLSTG